MSKKIIAKIFAFVILASTASVLFTGCNFPSNADPLNKVPSYNKPKVNGTIKSADVTESSGVTSSRCQSNVLWTHNDSGDDAFIFAINSSGENLGTWKISNAENIDWEDIASYKDELGTCFIYIGEIGDNKTARPERSVYRVPEPLIVTEDTKSTRKEPRTLTNAEILTFTYPDINQDAEVLMVEPKTGDIYVLTKRVSGPSGIYRLKPHFSRGEIQTAEQVGVLSVPAVPNGLLTGGDISPDGRRVIICDYTQAYEFMLPEREPNFDNVWKQQPETIDLGRRKGGEAICYSVDGTSLFATSEGRNSPVIEVSRQ